MYGYIFEVTNTKTGDKYLGKLGAVSFNKNYLGEESNDALAVAIEKYGRPSFVPKMIMPYESAEALDGAFAEMMAEVKPAKKVAPKKKEEPKEEEPEKIEEVKPVKKSTKAKKEN